MTCRTPGNSISIVTVASSTWTGDSLTQRRDAEHEPVTLPMLPGGRSAAGQQADDLREPALDAAPCLGAAELVRNADDDDGRRHADRMQRIDRLGKGPGPSPV